MPKRATEIATKAKWYHIVTLKMRVNRISYMRVERVTRKRPAKVPRLARGGARVVLSGVLKPALSPVSDSRSNWEFAAGGELQTITRRQALYITERGCDRAA
jgi:hypothetical protein